MITNKTAFIIQARMQSTRLPGKVMKPLPLTGGKPLLGWIIDELRRVDLPNIEIITATSVHKSDNVIERYCQTKNVKCYRGDEEDVLSRFQEITAEGNYDTVLRFTADNPFLDSEMIKNTVAFHLKHNNQYTNSTGIPLGMLVEVINGPTLVDLQEHPLTEMDKEHVTLYVRRKEEFKKGVFKTNINPELKNLRITVDYPSDFLLASFISGFSIKDGGLQGVKLIEKVWEAYPWIFKANQNNLQKKQFQSLEEEVAEARHILKGLDLNRASEFLKK